MSTTPVSLGGTVYQVPQPGEKGPTYDQDLTNYLIALASAFPQNGGQGAGFTALTSATANPATAGQIRLAHSDAVDWRNSANSANLALGTVAGVGGVDDLSFASTQLTGQTFSDYRITTAQVAVASAVVNFDTVISDTESAVTTGAAWHFTVPANKGGRYAVDVNVLALQNAGAGIQTLSIRANGVAVASISPVSIGAGAQQTLATSTVVLLAAGNTIDVLLATSANTWTTVAGAAASNITIQRMV